MARKLLVTVTVLVALSASFMTISNMISGYKRALALPPEPFETVNDNDVAVYAAAAIPAGSTENRPRIVIFFDYECGACRLLSRRLQGLASQTAKMGVGYIHFPLDGHYGAKDAAIASLCAARQGHFREYHEALLNTRLYHKGVWSSIARDVAMPDTVSFNECINGDEVRSLLDVHRELGEKLGVIGTPTLLIDNDLYIGMPSQLSKLLDGKLHPSADATRDKPL